MEGTDLFIVTFLLHSDSAHHPSHRAAELLRQKICRNHIHHRVVILATKKKKPKRIGYKTRSKTSSGALQSA